MKFEIYCSIKIQESTEDKYTGGGFQKEKEKTGRR